MQEFVFTTPPSPQLLSYGVVGAVVLAGGLAIAFARSRAQRIIAAAVLVPLTIFLYYIMIAGAAHNGISVGDTLIVKAPPFARNQTVTREQVVTASVVDWSQETSLKPTSRTNGAAIGTYESGWFTLANGKKALLLTNTSQVLCLELQDMYVMVAPDDFDGFVQAVNAKFVPVK